MTLNEKIEAAIRAVHILDMKDLRMKMEKDVGVWITYVDEDDNINNIDFPVGWSAGNTAMHLACQQGATEIYILGFDLSSYDEPLNNIYKGTDNYLPSDARGFNPVNWQNQMQTVFREFKDVQFSWVDAKEEFIQENNLSYLTKAEFCDKVTYYKHTKTYIYIRRIHMSLSTLKKSNSLDKLLGAVQAENAPQEKKSYVDDRLWKPVMDKTVMVMLLFVSFLP